MYSKRLERSANHTGDFTGFYRAVLCVFLFAAAGSVFGGGNAQKSPPSASKPAESAPVLEWDAFVEEQNTENRGPLRPPPETKEADRAEEVMKALAAVYADRIGAAEFRNGDWAAPIRGVWYFFAEGRLLPEELRGQAENFDPQTFYNYPEELPLWQPPGPEETERYRGMADRRRQHPPRRSQHFFDALWRARTKEEAWDRIKSIRFLGKTVLVHYAIMEELALVEEAILNAAKTEPAVRQWINNIATLDGWNWRSIADTQSRSYHAYGAALDILPRNYGRSNTYWLWTARSTPEWWAVPYDKRLHPPNTVIKAFEAYGFIWGGKWLFYDTMHFEYRPEILLLSGIPPSGLR